MHANLKEKVEDTVRRVFAGNLGKNAGDIDHEQHIFRDLEIDSLDAVEIVMDLEEAFEIEIPDEDWEKCATFGDVIRLIEAKVM